VELIFRLIFDLQISILLKNTIQILFILLFCNFSYSQEKLSDSLVHVVLSKQGDISENALLFLSKNDLKLSESHRNEWKSFLQKIEIEAKDKPSSFYPELCAKIGELIQQTGDFQTAYYFLYKTLKNEPNLYDKNKSYLAKFHEVMGISYYYFKRYSNSETHLKLSLSFPSVNEGDKISIYNTLALIQRDQQNIDESEKYTQKAYEIAIKLNREDWVGVLSGNLGFLAFERKNYVKAKELITRDYEISKNTNQISSEFNALTLLIQLDVINNESDSVTQNKFNALKALIDTHRNKTNYYAYYRVLTMYQEKKGDYKSAIESLRLASAYGDSITASRNLLSARNTEFQIDFEKNQAEIQILHERKKKDDLLILALFILSIVIITSASIIVVLIQRKRKSDKEILLNEKEQMENDLRNAEIEMRSVLSKMGEKNSVIEQLKEEIENVHSSEDVKTLFEKEKLLTNLQNFTLLTEDDWISFKRLFEKLNPGFFAYFQDTFPDISTAEIRLAALIRLDLANQEMARTLGISPDSVRKTNLRLRKKLGIENADELIHYINQLHLKVA